MMSEKLTEQLKELNELNNANKLQGVFQDLPIEVYHHPECPGISNSDLNLVHKSIEHYTYFKNNKKTTPAMLFGQALHDAVLSPEIYESNYVISPDFNKRTKLGKQEFEEFMLENEDKTIITQDMFETIQIMKDRLMNHPIVANLLDGAIREFSCFDVESNTGILRKCRPDIGRPEDRILIDLKTTVSAHRPDFERAVINYEYRKQAAFYLDTATGASAPNGPGYDKFMFIAIEKEPPYGIGVFNLVEPVIDVGRELYLRDLQKLIDARETKVYGYPMEIQSLSMPAYGFDLDAK